MKIHAEQGERGKWRWIVKEAGGKTRAVAPVQGFDTEREALQDARDVFGRMVSMPDPHPDAEGAEVYAGPRDFE